MGGIGKTILKAATGKGGIAGMAITAGLTGLKKILSKKGVRSNLEFLVGKILPGEKEPQSHFKALWREVDAIVDILSSHHINPNRIGVDGVPGSGKSTLARALAARLGMEAVCLDHQDMDAPLPFEKDLAIYEHHRLFRTQDIEVFDAIIYIDEPVEVSIEKVLQRKRGAYLVDIMDYAKMKKIGMKAFANASGESITVAGSCIRMKLKPEGGFIHRENITAELLAKGYAFTKLTRRNKEQLLFLCVFNKPSKGFKAYINPHAYDKEMLQALMAGLSPPRQGRGGRGR